MSIQKTPGMCVMCVLWASPCVMRIGAGVVFWRSVPASGRRIMGGSGEGPQAWPQSAAPAGGIGFLFANPSGDSRAKKKQSRGGAASERVINTVQDASSRASSIEEEGAGRDADDGQPAVMRRDGRFSGHASGTRGGLPPPAACSRSSRGVRFPWSRAVLQLLAASSARAARAS